MARGTPSNPFDSLCSLRAGQLRKGAKSMPEGKIIKIIMLFWRDFFIATGIVAIPTKLRI